MPEKLNITLVKEEILKGNFRDECVRNDIVMLAEAMEKDLYTIMGKQSKEVNNGKSV